MLSHSLAFVRELAKGGSEIIVADIGAADGVDTVAYCEIASNVTAFAFEPLSRNVRSAYELRRKKELEGRMQIFEIALGEADGAADFYESAGRYHKGDKWPYSGSLLPPGRHCEVYPWVTFEAPKKIAVRRLDSLGPEIGLSRIDFIHIDVQGFELAVLRGMGRMLDAVRGVWMEVEEIPLYEGQPLRAEVESFMRARGFELRLSAMGSVDGDQLWVRQGS
jgi:FkbM family methyltransferase